MSVEISTAVQVRLPEASIDRATVPPAQSVGFVTREVALVDVPTRFPVVVPIVAVVATKVPVVAFVVIVRLAKVGESVVWTFWFISYNSLAPCPVSKVAEVSAPLKVPVAKDIPTDQAGKPAEDTFRTDPIVLGDSLARVLVAEA